MTAGGVWRLGEGCGGLKEGMLAQGGRDATERLIVQPARLKIHYDTGIKKKTMGCIAKTFTNKSRPMTQSGTKQVNGMREIKREGTGCSQNIC